MTVTLALLGYAAAVAALTPRLLTGAWIYRSPRLAILLAHAAAWSVLSSVALASITCVATPGRVRDCLVALTGTAPMATGYGAAAAGLAVPILLFARLSLVAGRLTLRHRADRHRHGELLRLLGHHNPVLDATVVEAIEPAAYCLPGTHQVVVTSAALKVLSPPQLDAVLAHERAHLAGRHHLAIAWATILADAFPVPLFRRVQQVTVELVELLADDTAVRRASRAGLVGAIGALTASRVATVGLSMTGGRVLARVQRLLDPPPPLPVATRVGGAGAAISVIALPALLVGLPAVLAAGLVACPLVFG